jgi:signal transduction histidine kinase
MLVPDLVNAMDAVEQDGDPSLVAALRAAGIKSLIAVPMRVGDTVVGAVMFYSATRPFTVHDLGRAEGFAKSLASALENARLHQRLQVALRTREEFIALAGHELRTPLTALQLNAQELVRRASGGGLEQLARNVVNQSKRLERLSSIMLESIRASKFRFSFVPSPTDLSAIVRAAAATFEPVLKQRGSDLILHTDEPVVGEWDATQLDEALAYLLDNAAKFGAGRPVEVSVQRQDDTATLSVRDHGPGIQPDRVAHIFEAFERGVSAEHYGGLGLGLFVTRAIVEGHGGSITVDNRPGDGATFAVRLPLHPPAHV